MASATRALRRDQASNAAQRYVALLRGVSPSNANMADLRRSFEAAGFTDVRTLLSSGNVAFGAAPADLADLERRAEAAMQATLGRSFAATVRATAHLQALVDGEPFAGFALPPAAKCVVSFLRRPPARPVALPIEQDGVRILHGTATEVFTAYEPHPRGPVFMNLLERSFGKDITTRTLDTVRKCARA